jgi:hypothetical protein
MSKEKSLNMLCITEKSFLLSEYSYGYTAGVQYLAGVRDFSVRNIQTSSGANLASYPVGTRGFVCRDKAADALN